MKEIHITSRFKKDYKHLQTFEKQRVLMFIELLKNDEQLPLAAKDHILCGDYVGWRECHLFPDLLLVYSISDDVISFNRVGSHSQLFG